MCKPIPIPATESFPIVRKDGTCTSPCPHGQKVPIDVPTFGGEDIPLGSHLCLCCEFNGNSGHQPTDDGQVLCLYEWHQAQLRLGKGGDE